MKKLKLSLSESAIVLENSDLIDCGHIHCSGIPCSECMIGNDTDNMTVLEAKISINKFNEETAYEVPTVEKGYDVKEELEKNKTKYVRPIIVKNKDGDSFIAYADFYAVAEAFKTDNPAIDHAIKKLVALGTRGVKTRLQDVTEAHQALSRAIELEEVKQNNTTL